MADHDYKALLEAAVKARDLIGNQRGDITGAALDAWFILCDAVRKAPISGKDAGHA